ncbi:hypothetical protein [Mariprofundus ferrooxydans]|uniref:hypothetical protein n=1 Tax=Mariprofundus ferrooxydans TaxID=314344 RepID=UPI0014321ADF|nr:hypothetical protein [Mariprofundus ferrooxydans]
MKIKSVITSLVVLFMLTGCASSPDYSKPISKDKASISGTFADLASFYADNNSHVKIRKIDGKEYGMINGTTDPISISPGPHLLEVFASNQSAISEFTYKLNAEGGKRYQLKATLSDNQFYVRLLDISVPDKELLVSSKKIEVDRVQKPVLVY